jgi:hypothetical protein
VFGANGDDAGSVVAHARNSGPIYSRRVGGRFAHVNWVTKSRHGHGVRRRARPSTMVTWVGGRRQGRREAVHSARGRAARGDSLLGANADEGLGN